MWQLDLIVCAPESNDSQFQCAWYAHEKLGWLQYAGLLDYRNSGAWAAGDKCQDH